eukprot:349782-Chlamydomonas_euryale.AAC.2
MPSACAGGTPVHYYLGRLFGHPPLHPLLLPGSAKQGSVRLRAAVATQLLVWLIGSRPWGMAGLPLRFLVPETQTLKLLESQGNAPEMPPPTVIPRKAVSQGEAQRVKAPRGGGSELQGEVQSSKERVRAPRRGAEFQGEGQSSVGLMMLVS